MDGGTWLQVRIHMTICLGCCIYLDRRGCGGLWLWGGERTGSGESESHCGSESRYCD
jgi:hypothetical protein